MMMPSVIGEYVLKKWDNLRKPVENSKKPLKLTQIMQKPTFIGEYVLINMAKMSKHAFNFSWLSIWDMKMV